MIWGYSFGDWDRLKLIVSMSYQRAANLGIMKKIMLRKAFIAYIEAGGTLDIANEVTLFSMTKGFMK